MMTALLLNGCVRNSSDLSKNESAEKVTIVFAVRSIGEGKTIGVDDIAETIVAKDRIPTGLVSKEEAYENNRNEVRRCQTLISQC